MSAAVYWPVHAALLLAYPLGLRGAFPDATVQQPSRFLPLATQEFDIAIFVVMLLVTAFRRRVNLAAFAHTAVLYLEATVVLLLFLTDGRACVQYAAAAVVAHLLVAADPVATQHALVKVLGPRVARAVAPPADRPAPLQFVGAPELAAILLPGCKHTDTSLSKADRASTVLGQVTASAGKTRWIVLFTAGRDDPAVATMTSIAAEHAAAVTAAAAGSAGSSASSAPATRFIAIDTHEHPEVEMLLRAADERRKASEKEGAASGGGNGKEGGGKGGAAGGASAAAPDELPPCPLDLSLMTMHLPSVYAIEEGVVRRRLPVVGEDGAATAVVMNATNIRFFFKL